MGSLAGQEAIGIFISPPHSTTESFFKFLFVWSGSELVHLHKHFTTEESPTHEDKALKVIIVSLGSL